MYCLVDSIDSCFVSSVILGSFTEAVSVSCEEVAALSKTLEDDEIAGSLARSATASAGLVFVVEIYEKKIIREKIIKDKFSVTAC